MMSQYDTVIIRDEDDYETILEKCKNTYLIFDGRDVTRCPFEVYVEQKRLEYEAKIGKTKPAKQNNLKRRKL